jgi:hypothetical protein
MLFALVYWLLRRLIALAVGPTAWRTDEVEVLVLRHQLSILRRQAGRPRLRHRDQLFMAALSRVLPAIGGRRSWSGRRHSFAGTASWCAGNGPTAIDRPAADRRSQLRCKSSSCGWDGRTRGGDVCGSRANWPSSESGSRRRRSGRCCVETGLGRLPAALDRPGASSCAARRAASWPSTSSPSRRPGSARCTCSSPLSCGRGRSTWPERHDIQTRCGSPSRPATCRFISPSVGRSGS